MVSRMVHGAYLLLTYNFGSRLLSALTREDSICKAREAFLIIKDRKIDPDQEETYYFIGSVSAFIFFMFHVTPIRSLSLQKSETFA